MIYLRVLGIIAEYNPFHNGHLYHMQKAKELIRPDITIVCLSSDFVQRGAFASFGKEIRTRWALDGGADIVAELPSSFSMATAQRFAMGGISILNSLKITDLSFGSESPKEELLKTVRRIENVDPSYLRQKLKEGKNFARARFESLNDESLNHPNNILACEYIRAISIINPKINIHPVMRCDNGYDSKIANNAFLSASAIREKLLNNEECSRYTPFNVNDFFISPDSSLFKAIQYAVISKKPSEIRNICEVREGLENKIYKNALKFGTLHEYIMSVKSKRYTYASISRMLLNILLDAKKNMSVEFPPYVRILGMKKEATFYLKQIESETVIVNFKNALSLPRSISDYAGYELKSSGIYNIFAGKDPKTEFSAFPVII